MRAGIRPLSAPLSDLDVDLDLRSAVADKSPLERLHRVTELFVSGKEIVLSQDGPSGPILVWVNKLNAFQRSDAQRDGGAGQSRRIAALGDDSEDIALLRKRLADYTEERLVDSILGPRQSEFYLAGRDDVHADPAWTDRLVLIERGTELAEDGSHETEEETTALAAIQGAYMSAVTEASAARREQAREEFAGKSREELETNYLDAYRRMLGFEAFQDEYSRTEVWYALRDCSAKAGPNGWDHTKCTHQRLLPNRGAVIDLPDDLIEQVTTMLNDLNMPPATAGNSDAPQTSSGSSEQPSTAGDSTASTPTET